MLFSSLPVGGGIGFFTDCLPAGSTSNKSQIKSKIDFTRRVGSIATETSSADFDKSADHGQ
jgi:hypothetical protein